MGSFCSSCGNPLTDGARFCQQCGEAVLDSPPSMGSPVALEQHADAPMVATPWHRSPATWLLAVGALLVGTAGGYWLAPIRGDVDVPEDDFDLFVLAVDGEREATCSWPGITAYFSGDMVRTVEDGGSNTLRVGDTVYSWHSSFEDVDTISNSGSVRDEWLGDMDDAARIFDELRGTCRPEVPAGVFELPELQTSDTTLQEQPDLLQITGAALPPFTDSASDPAVGMPAPAAVGEGFDRERVTIGGPGQPHAAVFLAHWCPHCQAEVPRVQQWLDAGGGVPGVEIRSVVTSVSSARENYPPSAWLEREGWTVPVLVDTTRDDVLIAYGAGGLPYWVFVDADGNVARRSAGELSIAQLQEFMGEIAHR